MYFTIEDACFDFFCFENHIILSTFNLKDNVFVYCLYIHTMPLCIVHVFINGVLEDIHQGLSTMSIGMHWPKMLYATHVNSFSYLVRKAGSHSQSEARQG